MANNEIMNLDELLKMSSTIAADAEYAVKSCRKPQNIRREERVAKTWRSITHYLQEYKQIKEPVSNSVCEHDYTHFNHKDSVCSKCGETQTNAEEKL
jgi:hypothetical protein